MHHQQRLFGSDEAGADQMLDEGDQVIVKAVNVSRAIGL